MVAMEGHIVRGGDRDLPPQSLVVLSAFLSASKPALALQGSPKARFTDCDTANCKHKTAFFLQISATNNVRARMRGGHTQTLISHQPLHNMGPVHVGLEGKANNEPSPTPFRLSQAEHHEECVHA